MQLRGRKISQRPSLATMNSTAHIDLDGAILLADMISSSVRRLVRQSTHNALDVSGMTVSNNVHEVIATIVAATSQLSSLVRTPEEVLVDYATAVSFMHPIFMPFTDMLASIMSQLPFAS